MQFGRKPTTRLKSPLQNGQSDALASKPLSVGDHFANNLILAQSNTVLGNFLVWHYAHSTAHNIATSNMAAVLLG